jgi:hypothetical protein
MCLFAIGIEHPLDMTVQRLHDPDPRQHRVTPAAAQRVPQPQIGSDRHQTVVSLPRSRRD